MNRENHEDHHNNNQARNINLHRIQEDYINQLSEEIECKVRRKLSQESKVTQKFILGVFSRLDDFLLNPQPRARCRPVPETSRDSSTENHATKNDSSQNDPQAEVGVSLSQLSRELGPEETS